MCFNLSYLTFLTVNSKEPIAAEAHITVFLVQRHTSSIIFAWRAFTRTLWDWEDITALYTLYHANIQIYK